ncbi:piggyBac transposable element-derived protein 4-like [Penaeus vannamei]|uniref:piggyBac transposable element-derived protein 4-like n=1 Tax=Penaeus vannamei TaxID=6689 RepID=UPI00387F95A9
MGFSRKPRLSFKWSWRNPGISQPIFPSTISRERFEQISRNLHFVANEADHPGDYRLWKLRRMIDMFGDRSRSVFVPNQSISLCKSRGRLSFSTYNPNKWARFGVVYKLSASVLGIRPCTGFT